MRIALLAHSSVCGAVGSPVSYRHTTDGPGWPPLAAGADVLEGVAVQTVAAYPAVFDTDAATSYGDGVKHSGEVCMCCPSWVVNVLCPIHGYESARKEHRRRARLSRWQEQR